MNGFDSGKIDQYLYVLNIYTNTEINYSKKTIIGIQSGGEGDVGFCEGLILHKSPNQTKRAIFSKYSPSPPHDYFYLYAPENIQWLSTV